jgi:hypothetical protein
MIDCHAVPAKLIDHSAQYPRTRECSGRLAIVPDRITYCHITCAEAIQSSLYPLLMWQDRASSSVRDEIR